MRRILITQSARGWGFERNGEIVVASTPLLAALEARVFGEALQGRAVGYIVRLDTLQGIVTLHSRVFGEAAGESAHDAASGSLPPRTDARMGELATDRCAPEGILK